VTILGHAGRRPERRPPSLSLEEQEACAWVRLKIRIIDFGEALSRTGCCLKSCLGRNAGATSAVLNVTEAGTTARVAAGATPTVIAAPAAGIGDIATSADRLKVVFRNSFDFHPLVILVL
jgi:hypothetical protein